MLNRLPPMESESKMRYHGVPSVDKTILLLIGAAGAALAGTSAILLFRRRPIPAERERLRLAKLHTNGRLVHGELEEIRGTTAFYRYELHGVAYSAAQDLALFSPLSEGDLQDITGQVIIKYDRENPSNSMIHCDEWSGLRMRARHPASSVRS
jgi:hypothetical protein